MTNKQLYIQQNLIVTRTSTVYLFAYVAQFSGQQQFYLRMNILYTIFNNKFSAFAPGINRFQFSRQSRQLFFLKQSYLL